MSGNKFITREEEIQIQTSYIEITKHLKCDELIPYLLQERIISMTEKENIEAMKTNNKQVSQNSLLI